MNPRGGVHRFAEFSHLEFERHIFEFLLHLPSAKGAQVASPRGATAMALCLGQLGKFYILGSQPLPEAPYHGQCLLLRSGDVLFLPRRRSSRVFMLYKNMGGPYFGGLVICHRPFPNTFPTVGVVEVRAPWMTTRFLFYPAGRQIPSCLCLNNNNNNNTKTLKKNIEMLSTSREENNERDLDS